MRDCFTSEILFLLWFANFSLYLMLIEEIWVLVKINKETKNIFWLNRQLRQKKNTDLIYKLIRHLLFTLKMKTHDYMRRMAHKKVIWFSRMGSQI